MKLPEASENIYPRTVENIRAILEYYWPTAKHSEIQEAAENLYEKRGVYPNQLEFVAQTVLANQEKINELGINKSIWGSMRDVRDAIYFKDENNWEIGGPGNKTNGRKIKAFQDFFYTEFQEK